MSEWEWIGDWSVSVNGVGVIGTVGEHATEELALSASLKKFGKEGPRCQTGALPLPHIYEDDDFSVKKL